MRVNEVVIERIFGGAQNTFREGLTALKYIGFMFRGEMRGISASPWNGKSTLSPSHDWNDGIDGLTFSQSDFWLGQMTATLPQYGQITHMLASMRGFLGPCYGWRSWI
jgi:hypothetical protein